MNRPIGEKFEHNGRTYIVVEDDSDTWMKSCYKCAIRGYECMDYADEWGECESVVRYDGKSVHFEQIEKHSNVGHVHG